MTERYAYTACGFPTITDASGIVRTSSAIGNRYTYTDRKWAGTLGLYHYRARMYEATAGRFCSRDPIGYWGASFSVFSYLSNRPLYSTDPIGLKPATSELPCPLPCESKKPCEFEIDAFTQVISAPPAIRRLYRTNAGCFHPDHCLKVFTRRAEG